MGWGEPLSSDGPELIGDRKFTREWLATEAGQLHSAVTDSLPYGATVGKMDNWRAATDAFLKHLHGQGYIVVKDSNETN